MSLEESLPTTESRRRGVEVLQRLVEPAEEHRSPLRLLLVFAHADDEVLAVGGRMERMASSRLLTLTDGAPADGRDARDHGFADLDAYRQARRVELREALADAGPEFVLPVDSAVADQSAALHLFELTHLVADRIALLQPEGVLTHPYEGGHPDHDATAYAVHGAVRLLAAGGFRELPVLLESPSYHASEDGSMQTGAFLPGSESSDLVEARLTWREAERKRRRLACFASQAATLAQFGAERELFRIAPNYDFNQPPHQGTLLYERFGWGMTGERFCALARAASARLFA